MPSPEFGYEADMNFIKIRIGANDQWLGKRIADLDLPENVIIAILKRRNKALIPNGNMVLREGDRVFLYTHQHLLDVNEIEI